MVPPVQVSPFIKVLECGDEGISQKLHCNVNMARYSALLVGILYGKTRCEYLKPIAEEERRVEAEEKKKREELERIAKQLAEAEESILK